MSIVRQLGTNSAIYAGVNLLQKGAAFLLLPLYTAYLSPDAYGILAIVTGVNGFLAIAFTCGLGGAVTRFYFEHQDDPALLARFWGSVLVFVVLVSAVLGAALLLVGEPLLRPVIAPVPFWPYVALGIVTTFFMPFFTMYLSVLQTRNQARSFALMSVGHFAVTTGLMIGLVVAGRQGVQGALVASLVAAATFFVVALWRMRHDVTPCLDWALLRPALRYSAPQIPHAVAGQVTAITDRLVLNSRLGTASAGLYAVGAMVALVVEVAANSVNRAYVPLSMAALKRNEPAGLAQLRAIGAAIVGGFCLLGAAVGAYATEILRLLASAPFAPAAVVVPILAFSGVSSAIYYLLVNILFYDTSATRLLPIGTLSAAALNVLLAFALIPYFGLVGAAAANLSAQVATTCLVALISRRFDPVRWQYGRYALAFAASLCASLALSAVDLGAFVPTVAAKLAGLLLLCIVVGAIVWRRPFVLFAAGSAMLRGRTSNAASLLFPTAT